MPVAEAMLVGKGGRLGEGGSGRRCGGRSRIYSHGGVQNLCNIGCMRWVWRTVGKPTQAIVYDSFGPIIVHIFVSSGRSKMSCAHFDPTVSEAVGC